MQEILRRQLASSWINQAGNCSAILLHAGGTSVTHNWSSPKGGCVWSSPKGGRVICGCYKCYTQVLSAYDPQVF
jgi:hypothetical protein